MVQFFRCLNLFEPKVSDLVIIFVMKIEEYADSQKEKKVNDNNQT